MPVNTSLPITLAPSRGKTPRFDARRDDHRVGYKRPTFGELLENLLPLAFVPCCYGPPAILLLGPWLVLVLLLAPPTAFLITLVVVVALVVLVTVGLLGALVVSPYLVVRQLRARHATRRRRHTVVLRARRAAGVVGDSRLRPGGPRWPRTPAVHS
jgi:hypothetical protein